LTRREHSTKSEEAMRFAVLALVALALCPRPALAIEPPPPESAPPPSKPPEADESDGSWDGDYDMKATRRSDFTFGGSFGLALGSGYGYPNEVDKIDDARFVSDTGVALGSAYDVWLGGALRDWFTFGLGITGFGVEGKGQLLSGGGFIFRIETFPFYAEGGKLRDVGAYASFGLGSATIEEDGEEVADGGALSIVNLGAFWEPWRFGKFAAGPVVDYRHVFSQTLSFYAATGGIRLAFYAGP
jgi:hypothetical protein